MTLRHIGILSFAVVCVGIAASSPEPHLPAISDLERVTFTTGLQPAGGAPPFAEAFEMKKLFLAYGAQSKVLAKYRDPILTRGAQGEAIFRKVSPAVVAVVVGSLNKDNDFDPEGLGTGAIDLTDLLYQVDC